MNWKLIGIGALTGLGGAAKADWDAFRSWKSFQDARRYNWGIAAWRWFQGAAIGAMGASALGPILGA